MDSSPLRNIQPLQAALANAFCYLISSMDDNNVYVAQRATLYLGTIHDTAIRVRIIMYNVDSIDIFIIKQKRCAGRYKNAETLWEEMFQQIFTIFLSQWSHLKIDYNFFLEQ